jgi:predicted amidohydrolase
MENTIVACVQQRMGIMATHDEFESQARRFLHQAQAKGAQLVIFPELAGLMLAPPLISGLKLGFIKRADEGSRPTAGVLSRGLGRVSGAAAGMLGGGLQGSLVRLLDKRSDALQDVYFETFGKLAQEYRTAILGGSLYLVDQETGTLRNRAYLFDVSGEILGFQDKLNLAPDEESLATPGSDLSILETPFGRMGVLIGRDLLYPELARLLALQGAEFLAGVVAGPGAAQSAVLRQALAMRVEENQIFGGVSFLLGKNYLGDENREAYFGQSALLAPVSMTAKGDGVLVQAGTNRTEALIATELDAEGLHNLWQTSRFRPRQQWNLGNLGTVLAEMYGQGLTIDQAIDQRIAGPIEPEPVLPSEPLPEPEPVEEEVVELLAEPEAMEETLEPEAVEAVVLDEELSPGAELEAEVESTPVPEIESLIDSEPEEEPVQE